jgi:glycosyltransferase involved in cell wall biosynthesis
MTILHIAPSPRQVGGMETFIGDLLNSSLAEHHNILLLDIAKPKLRQFGSSAYKTGYAVFRRNISLSLLSYAYSFQFVGQFLFLLAFKKFDIIHIHTASYTSFWEKCFYINLGKMARKKVVLHVHGALFKEFYQNGSDLSKKLIKNHLEKCDAVIVLSEAWKNFFQEFVDASRLHVVKNGINISPFKDQQQKSGIVSFLHMGEVSQRKGIYDILKVVDILKANDVKCFFDIVGPGEIEKVNHIIAEKNIDKYITLHGPQFGAARFDFFYRAHCFILASYAEGFPIAMIEALAAGLPIISTTVGGIPDMIRHTEHGFLCDAGDIDALAHNIKKIVIDASLLAKMASRNREYAAEHFDINKCADKISTLYQKLLRAH